MTRQCVGCGTALPDEGRSPRCERCWIEHQKQRNRSKVQAHRARERSARPALTIQIPGDASRRWLRESDLGIAEPIDCISELLASGRDGTDLEIGEAARDGLERYDLNRQQFEEWVARSPGAEGAAAEWRAFFEAVRGTLQ